VSRVVVTATGLICALGEELAAVHAALEGGASGIGPLDAETGAGLRDPFAAEARAYDPSRTLGDRNLRPLDRTSRLTASAAGLALSAGGLGPAELANGEVGLVLGTQFGSLRTIAEFDRRALQMGANYASPLDFANSVINAAAGQAAIWHGLRGVNATVAGGPVAGLLALGDAADRLRDGAGHGLTALLAGGAEELCREALLGFERLGATAGHDGAAPLAVPLHARRNGFRLGEGAALALLETAERAAARGARPLGEILGHGEAFDPTRGGDPASAAAALARAVRSALAEAELEAAQVDLLALGASGSPARDRAEVAGLALALGRDRLAALPVLAAAGQLGECLGAGGALSALLALESLRSGRLPGIAGLDEPDPALPPTDLAAASRPLRGRVALVTALALDGPAAALLVALPEVG
jgi:3-oxoacyl-[acyl-carrier-protein] synthase II